MNCLSDKQSAFVNTLLLFFLSHNCHLPTGVLRNVFCSWLSSQVLSCPVLLQGKTDPKWQWGIKYSTGPWDKSGAELIPLKSYLRKPRDKIEKSLERPILTFPVKHPMQKVKCIVHYFPCRICRKRRHVLNESRNLPLPSPCICRCPLLGVSQVT